MRDVFVWAISAQGDDKDREKEPSSLPLYRLYALLGHTLFLNGINTIVEQISSTLRENPENQQQKPGKVSSKSKRIANSKK